MVTSLQTRSLLVLGVHVTLADDLRILTVVVLGHEVRQAAELQTRGIRANQDLARRRREQATALLAVWTADAGALGHVRVRVRTPPSHSPVRVDPTVDLAISLQLDPRIVPVSDLPETLVNEQILRQKLRLRVIKFAEDDFVDLRATTVSKLLRLPPVLRNQSISNVHPASRIERDRLLLRLQLNDPGGEHRLQLPFDVELTGSERRHQLTSRS